MAVFTRGCPIQDDGLAVFTRGWLIQDARLAVFARSCPIQDDRLAVFARGWLIQDDGWAVFTRGLPIQDDGLAVFARGLFIQDAGWAIFVQCFPTPLISMLGTEHCHPSRHLRKLQVSQSLPYPLRGRGTTKNRLPPYKNGKHGLNKHEALHRVKNNRNE